ncbi:ProQ/FINO family protein [Vreelandella rituensis]|uniref:ABC transporter substrate-binding protein n=1 Tax=Vreelandella rituensis TaxID=2282306 RepID=A0A368UAS7_9GAMM|nr:ProQ/FINO family protein [Halomonas rituensis]RCV92323.1 ABC transporter substrate-binding protein [Halomonas rituensis]
MTQSVLQLLEHLERRLDMANVELQTLREENARLKAQLRNLAEPPAPVTSEPALPEPQPQPAVTSSTVQVEVQPSSQQPAEENVSAAQAPPSPQALLNQWYERYPKTFFKGHTQPLKVGIHEDLAAKEPWSNKLIRRALASYVNLPRYLKAMREGSTRIDLEGRPAGVVDKDAAQHAAEKRTPASKQRSNAPRMAKQGAPAVDKKTSGQPGVVKDKEAVSRDKRSKAATHSDKPQTVHHASKPSAAPKYETMESKLAALRQKYEGS